MSPAKGVATTAVSRGASTDLDGCLEDIGELIRIPSISADPTHAADVESAAQWIRAFVHRAGGSCEVVRGSSGRPLAVGEIPATATPTAAPTVVIYGHVDVQPPGPLDSWDSPPFEPLVKDGWLYGRGAADDKGNFYLLLKAAESLAAERRLPVNVRVLCDAEEEVLGTSVVDWIEEDERGADAALVFDGPMPRRGVSAFKVGQRGLVFAHLRVRTGARDLHSGFYGGAALNAAETLAGLLANAGELGPQLSTDAVLPSDAELADWAQLEPGLDVLAAQGAHPRDARVAKDFYLRTFATTVVEVNGIRAGEADLLKTVIPMEAVANVSVRVAPGQDPHTVAHELERLLRARLPKGAELEFELSVATPAAVVPADTPALRLASDAFERVLGQRPLLLRSGGTLPVIAALVRKGIPTVVSGFDVPEGNVHAPNERLLLENISLGLSAARETLLAFSDLPSTSTTTSMKGG